jgi:hypothetical protein
MNIFELKQGDKLICTNNEENNWGSCDSASENLELNKVYTVKDVEIHSWHTKIFLEEIEGKRFNSVHFGTILGD